MASVNTAQTIGRTVSPAGAPGMADYVLLVLLAAIWGSSFMFIKIAVVTVPPATMTAMRMITATAVLLPVALAAGASLRFSPRLIGLLCLAAAFGNAMPFTLIAWGQQGIDSGLAAILMGTMPMFTLLLAHLFTHDEKLNGLKLVAVLLGFAGIVVLIGPQKLVQLGGQTISQLAVAGGALCYAINAIISKRLLGEPRMAVAAAVMAASMLMMLPVAWTSDFAGAMGPVVSDASLMQIASVVLLGLLHTGIATLIMFRLISNAGATFFSQINFLVPVFGVFWGTALLGERPEANAFAALALILAGIAVARKGQRR
ncbi:MAG: EamA family transporter [Rhodobiaceae bacterium]|nr:EamA family transporter [Rhodobiaceae bacterium]MCC0051522.1 EamA family transporter [Rhodobiaceae bacterium]